MKDILKIIFKDGDKSHSKFYRVSLGILLVDKLMKLLVRLFESLDFVVGGMVQHLGYTHGWGPHFKNSNGLIPNFYRVDQI